MSDDKREFLGPEGTAMPLEDFDFAKLNKCGFAWEFRIPGVDCEESWEDGDSSFDSLEEAVLDILPNYRLFGLTMENAARLLLEVGILAGTGCEIEAE
jgi:hypothetical protein